MARAPVLMINRQVDRDRRQGFRRAAQALGVAVARVPALDGHQPGALAAAGLGRFLGAQFWGSDRIKPGAFACYMSHRRAWARIARDGRPHLVAEDDARLLADPAGLDMAGHDLIFANDRLIGWARAAGLGPEGTVWPAAGLLARMAARGVVPGTGGLAAGPGADGYLLSAAGARVLMGLAEADRVVAGVDWAMLWRASDTATLPAQPAIPELGLLAGMLGTGAPRLRAGIAARPLTTLRPGLASAIRHDRTVPIAAFRRSLAGAIPVTPAG